MTQDTSAPANAPVAPAHDPLLSLHKSAGGGAVETLDYTGIEIVSTMGHPQAEYAAIRKACGLMDAAQRGVLEVGGKDRHAFLNNFLTNLTWSKETKSGMSPGTGVYSFLLNGKGRIVADMNVLETGDAVLLETDARLVPMLATTLAKYVFTEKVTFTSRLPTDPVNGLRVFSLLGPGSLGVLQEQGAVISELSPLGSRKIPLFGTDLTVFRDDLTGGGTGSGYHVLVPTAKALDIWMGLIKPYGAQTNKRSLRPVGWAMFNAARIEAGRPLYGIDFTDQSLPAETGRFEAEKGGAVSVVKGCYLGQEIVARMHARQQVAKQVVGLKTTPDLLPIAGADLLSPEGATVGGITSSTISPILGGACIALGTVKKSFTTEGTVLRVAAEGKVVEARVVPLPFVTPPSA